MPIKTLHLTNAWHPTSGGVAAFYRALMREANRRGHEFRLIVPAERDGVELVGEHVKIFYIAAPPAPLNSSYRTIYPTQFLFKGSKLQMILAEERPDLVEIADKYTLVYLGALLRMRLLRGVEHRPVVIGLSHERMDDNFRSYLGGVPFARQLCSFYMRWIYFPFFDHHIANSSYTGEELRRASVGHPVPRGTWIHHVGVDLGELSPELRSHEGRRQLRARCCASDNSVLLLYVGRLAPEKNLGLLFHVAERLNQTSTRPFHLIVVGNGMERPQWERYSAQRLPGQVIFFDYIRDRRALAAIYANADIFVHPNAHEPFGIAPLEAMASGLPLLAPDSGGVTSYAHAGNAWLAPPNVRDFAHVIEEIVSNPALTGKRVEQALLTAQSYGWDTVAASFLDLYRDLYNAFYGLPARTSADFYSTPARPGNARFIGWAAAGAKKAFAAVARFRDSTGRRASTPLESKSHQPSS